MCLAQGPQRSDAVVHLLFACADPESFVRGGPTLFLLIYFSFSLMMGRRIQITLLGGHRRPASVPLADRCWPDIELNYWLSSFVIASIAKEPYIFVIFQGGPDPCPTTLLGAISSGYFHCLQMYVRIYLMSDVI